jgi:hypothetical protein
MISPDSCPPCPLFLPASFSQSPHPPLHLALSRALTPFTTNRVCVCVCVCVASVCCASLKWRYGALVHVV